MYRISRVNVAASIQTYGKYIPGKHAYLGHCGTCMLFIIACLLFFNMQTGQTLLHYASSLGQIDIVIYLINRHDCQIYEQEQVTDVF